MRRERKKRKQQHAKSTRSHQRTGYSSEFQEQGEQGDRPLCELRRGKPCRRLGSRSSAQKQEQDVGGALDA